MRRCTIFSAKDVMLVTWWTVASLIAAAIACSKPALAQQECVDGGSDEGTCSSSPAAGSAREVECGVYMAPSTLGDFTNLGIFTGKDLGMNETINFPDIAIPLLFRGWAKHPTEFNRDGSLWDRYIWKGKTVNIESYNDLDRSQTKSVFIPGVGCTVNSLLDMNNIESVFETQYGTANVPRSDPGAGAFSPYHSAITRTTQSVASGSELFASYGHGWIPTIPDVAVTLDEHLDDADAFMMQYDEWVQQMRARHPTELDDGHIERLWRLMKSFPQPRSASFSVLPHEEWSVVQQRQAAQRKEQQGQQQQMASNESKRQSSTSRHFIEKKGRRSLEWLQQYGKCQDHMHPDDSTLPHAGRGAFATRDLPKGTIVGYAPLIHIAKQGKDLLEVPHDGVRNSEPKSHEHTKPDLVTNYSFGHRNSTVLLTPYGGIVNYINHNPNPSSINVRIQWPDRELIAHKPDWLQQDVEFLANANENIGLSFDYVATRDIGQGEEIFMDYGPEWEAAWNRHVAQWQPPLDSASYVHSSQYERPRYFLTEEELEQDPYPPNLRTMCYESFRKKQAGSQMNNVLYSYLPVVRPTDHRVHCTVLQRHRTSSSSSSSHTYTVQLRSRSSEHVVVSGFEESAIFLYDTAFSQDWHLTGAFRHKLFVPDDMWPESWNNLV